jgi:hypothetical protein
MKARLLFHERRLFDDGGLGQGALPAAARAAAPPSAGTRHAAASIAELARALGRDYKRVHADVEALAAAGLIDRTPAGRRADHGEIRARITV